MCLCDHVRRGVTVCECVCVTMCALRHVCVAQCGASRPCGSCCEHVRVSRYVCYCFMCQQYKTWVEGKAEQEARIVKAVKAEVKEYISEVKALLPTKKELLQPPVAKTAAASVSCDHSALATQITTVGRDAVEATKRSHNSIVETNIKTTSSFVNLLQKQFSNVPSTIQPLLQVHCFV